MPKGEIESLAEKLLQKMKTDSRHCPRWPLDPTRVAEFLGLDTDIIPLPSEGNEIVAAMLCPIEHKIVINENNSNSRKGFEESSIAHEMGHWLLHVNRKEAAKYREIQNKGLATSKFPPLHRIYGSKNIKQIEWQAQYFAGCLLMPRFKLEEVKKGRDLTKWKHLYAIADELGVTISNLTYRLQQDLGWIHIPKGSKQIYIGKSKANSS